MKQLFFLLLLLVTGSLAATAQGPLLIFNNTDCEITYEIRAHWAGAGCGATQSGTFVLAPGASEVFYEFDDTFSPSPPDPDTPPIWNSIKFGFNSDECFAGDDIGLSSCGFPSTWSSGSCQCEGQTVYAAWAGGGGFTTVIFHY